MSRVYILWWQHGTLIGYNDYNDYTNIGILRIFFRGHIKDNHFNEITPVL